EKPIGPKTYEATLKYFEALMQQLHPFMPFITEEIHQFLRDLEQPQFLLNTLYDESKPASQEILHQGDLVTALVTAVRDLRAKNQMKAREPLDLVCKPANAESFEAVKTVVQKLAFIENFVDETSDNVTAMPITLRQDQFFVLTGKKVDATKEIERIEKELAHSKGFLQSVMVKLNNEKFVSNAKPDVLERERQKASDAENKIKLLLEELGKLGVNA
ncbi:MAG TPA: class I tRNA ligase family protein, partial [Chitinophagales bacterium]|nr:class I tRNA ligase family protein [Chitinophagales bacterium]